MHWAVETGTEVNPMPYLVRYAGERGNRFRETTRERIIIDLRAAMPADDVGDAIQRIEKGERVRTRAATYYFTEEPLPTEEQLRERLRAAVRAAKKLIAAGKARQG